MSSQASLFAPDDKDLGDIISPSDEISAYEALWMKYRTVPKMAKLFAEHRHALPTIIAEKEGLTPERLKEFKEKLRAIMPFNEYSALFYGDYEYPQNLRVARNPIEILYYQGALELLSAPNLVSIVGARTASEDGLMRAKRLAKMLVNKGFVVMSGLAEGVDTAAHSAALEAGGRTVAVIGTPLNQTYPQSNVALQKEIAKNHLLVSQVPFYFYSGRTPLTNRAFFPERNITMSALSRASIIVEASETSGTLYQARAAIHQKRKLFILKSCFNRGLKWPEYFVQRGAKKVETGEEILEELQKDSIG